MQGTTYPLPSLLWPLAPLHSFSTVYPKREGTRRRPEALPCWNTFGRMVAAVKHATLMGNPLHAPDAICACRSLVPIYKNTPSATILVSTCFQQEVAVFGGRSRSKASSLNPLAYRSAAKSIRKHIVTVWLQKHTDECVYKQHRPRRELDIAGRVWNGMEKWWHASDVLRGILGHRTAHPDVPPCVTFLSQSIARDARGAQSTNTPRCGCLKQRYDLYAAFPGHN
jgi:hypothetical protein